MLSRAHDVTGTGFVVLDRIYADGRPAMEALGGSCGNVLISLAMLSVKVAPIIALGNDDVGHRMVSQFADAGACTKYIRTRDEQASPILAQILDTALGQHSFSFICPDTDKPLPRYRPIDEEDVAPARGALKSSCVFYVDRISQPIVEAMECAANGGSLVYFEPSSVGDRDLFARAVSAASILKFSSDRLHDDLAGIAIAENKIAIVTYGAQGLEIRRGGDSCFSEAFAAPQVVDTSGSGDMVSVGIIDHIVSTRSTWTELALEILIDGIRAGQRLAAANCAYPGARGLFRHHDAKMARSIMDGSAGMDWHRQFDLFPTPTGDYSAATE